MVATFPKKRIIWTGDRYDMVDMPAILNAGEFTGGQAIHTERVFFAEPLTVLSPFIPVPAHMSCAALLVVNLGLRPDVFV